MAEQTASSETSPATGKAPVIITWIARLVVVGILGMGAVMKFANGGEPLAQYVPGGAAGAMAIGAIETIAIILILIPKTVVYGGLLATVTMLGAIGSHLSGTVPMDGDFEGMIVMAGVALLAALTVVAVRRKDLPFLS